MSHHSFLVFLIFFIITPSFSQSQLVPAEGNSSAQYWLSAGALVVFALVLMLVFLVLEKLCQEDGANQSCKIIQHHTSNFNKDKIPNSIKEHNLIGRGASGAVYKVQLSGGTTVAVKQILKSRTAIRGPEFDFELDGLRLATGYVSVVQLHCIIINEDSDLLVYEYMPNGSLWDRLHTDQTTVMDWQIRYEIAMAAATGLEYLHQSCGYQVIHGGVKSSNILFDQEMKPKIADLGVAKIMQTNEDTNSPEGDVYNFGVVMMELVTGKKPLQPEFGEDKDIVCWVEDQMSNDNLIGLVDPHIADESKQKAIEVLTIAIGCTSRLPAQRPPMNQVLQMLENIEPVIDIRLFIHRQQLASRAYARPAEQLGR